MQTGTMMYQQLQENSQQIESTLIQHAPLVKKIAHHLMGRLPSSVQIEDLIQAGMMGLLEAAKNFDSGKGASFETYAGIRIRGMMLDEVRKGDWVPRSVHRNARMIAEIVQHLEHQFGRDATDREIADALQIPIEEYHQMLLDSSGAQLYAIDEMLQNDENLTDSLTTSSSNPLDDVVWEGFRHRLIEGVASLPEREKLVLSLYYDEEMNLKEIGLALGVSESRVCQLHAQAMARLQSKVREWSSLAR